jgi:hypothetical protein
MKVKEIKWFSKDSDEASVIVSDGVYECLAFCHPCYLNVGDEIIEPLHSLDETSVHRVENQKVNLKRESGNDNWNHELVALVLDIEKNLVQVGQIKIILNSLPGDVANGDFVECFPSRLDIIG